MGYVYVLRCFDGSYYIGSSSELKERLAAHRSGSVKFTKSRLPIELIFVKEFSSYAKARTFEVKVKSWKKRQSIEKMLGKSDNIVENFK